MPSLTLTALALATGVATAHPCGSAVYSEIMSAGPKDASAFVLSCSLTLKPSDVVRRRLLLQGGSASGVTIDCNGAQIGEPGAKVNSRSPTIGIWSQQVGTIDAPVWSRPTDIAIRNCSIFGNVRIWGIGAGGDIPIQIRESRTPDFTTRAQLAAPTRVQITNSHIHAAGTIPLYLGPGTTAVTISGSTITGRAAGAIYLDAESADNRIVDNRLPLTVDQQIIAIDGSARNLISGNDFSSLGKRGGILLYRNCGEYGIIRHQTPSENRIYNNRFGPGSDSARTVIENARSGGSRKPSFCAMDVGYPFGSSIDDDGLGRDNFIGSNGSIP